MHQRCSETLTFCFFLCQDGTWTRRTCTGIEEGAESGLPRRRRMHTCRSLKRSTWLLCSHQQLADIFFSSNRPECHLGEDTEEKQQGPALLFLCKNDLSITKWNKLSEREHSPTNLFFNSVTPLVHCIHSCFHFCFWSRMKGIFSQQAYTSKIDQY